MAAAERRIKRAKPDVVVLDVLMPGESGLELCRRLKDGPATRHIGVVLLSGAEGDARSEARAAGADAYLAKPFSPLQLLAVADRLAGGRGGVPRRIAAAPDEDGVAYLVTGEFREFTDASHPS